MIGSVVRSLAILTAAVVISGCGTVLQIDDGHGPAIYGGIRFDVRSITKDKDVGIALMMAVDLPFSLVADTVILPWSVYNEISQGGIEVISLPESIFKAKEKESKTEEKESSGKTSK